MWLDNASDIDILFYEPYADVISEIALNKEYKPLTIGVFGVWGAGKSTLLKLIESKVSEGKVSGINKKIDKEKNICVNINAWSFEGYEDAKIAVIEALLRELYEIEPIRKKIGEKIGKLIKKLDIFKLSTKAVGIAAPVVASIATGNPIPLVLGLNGNSADIGNNIRSISDAVQSIHDDYMKDDAGDNADDNNSIVNNIRKFREDFEKALDSEDIENVVVLIDDLDRCQPDRIIETLEAIKLFLSVKKTTFIIAADENVIQYAIHRKYPPIAEYSVDLDKEYIEKIIQLPIYIPDLSSKDIENYLMLLVAQQYTSKEEFAGIVKKIKEEGILISEQLIDLSKLNELTVSYLDDVQKKLFHETADTIAGIKSIVAGNLKGNPRQAKRFLNTFITKRKLAELYYRDEKINIKVLAKLLVLQKLDNDLFIQLNDWNREFTTENEEFKKMRLAVTRSEKAIEDKYKAWSIPVIAGWLASEPVELEKIRLDRYFYLTRENLHKVEIDESSLSLEAKDILQRIGSATTGLYEGIVEDMLALPVTDQDDIIKVLLPKVEKGELDLLFIRYLFDKYESYRDKIASSLKNVTQEITMSAMVPLNIMYKIDEKRVNGVLEVWKDAGNINDTIIEKIKR